MPLANNRKKFSAVLMQGQKVTDVMIKTSANTPRV